MRIEEKPSKDNKLGQYADLLPGQAMHEVRPSIPQWDYEPLPVKHDNPTPYHAGMFPIDPKPIVIKGRTIRLNLKRR